jgi:FAD-linked oxidoreductase
MKSNWLGNIPFQHKHFVRPENEEQLAELVSKANRQGEKIRVVGAGHSWSPACASKDYLVNLDKLSGIRSLDPTQVTATVGAGSRLKDLNHAFWEKGYAFKNLGSIAEQSIAGAISTGTHGSGIKFGALSAGVVGLKLLDGQGNIHSLSKENNPDTFGAFPVSLGTLGILTEVQLEVCPTYYLQEVRKPMDFDEALEALPELIQSCDHFKMWWFPYNKKIQTYSIHRSFEKPTVKKAFNLLREDSAFAQGVFAKLLQLGNYRPLVPAINRFITAIQFKNETNVGRNFDVFNMVMPPKHHESEYAIPVEHTVEALKALRDLIHLKKHPVNFITELRFVKGDDHWLSPAYGRDVCFLGGYMAGENGWSDFLKDYENLLLPYSGRPHWGKEFTLGLQKFPLSYPRWEEFKVLRKQFDPNDVFSNDWTDALFA